MTVQEAGNFIISILQMRKLSNAKCSNMAKSRKLEMFNQGLTQTSLAPKQNKNNATFFKKARATFKTREKNDTINSIRTTGCQTMKIDTIENKKSSRKWMKMRLKRCKPQFLLFLSS